MIEVCRLGHATLTTPDLDRQVAYYTAVVGLTLVERDAKRAFLASKQGLEAIALEPGPPNALSRLAFQVTPGLLTAGIVVATVIGLVGGLFPALRAARLPIAAALREL